MSKRDELTGRVLALNEQIFAASQPAAREGWPDLELTYPQLRVLGALATGPKRMSELVEILGSQSSTMSATVERLVVKGLVQRGESSSDRRVVLCSLTGQGQGTIEQLARMNRLHLEEMTEFLTEDEMATVVLAMEALLRAAERQSTSEKRTARRHLLPENE